MDEILSAVFRGLTFGSVYALLAVGLVLTYKTSGVFNLAFGAQAFAAGAVYYDARVRHDWPIPLALLLAVVFVAPLLGLRPRPAAVPVPAHRAADRGSSRRSVCSSRSRRS